MRLTENYNYHLPPPILGPVRVNFSINLRNVLEVNEVSETVSLETTLRMFWRDERLSLKMEALPERFESLDKDFVTLHPSVAEMIWVPDIFIDQAVNVRRPRYLTPAASLRVYRDGTIRYKVSLKGLTIISTNLSRYASRVNYDVACSMDFHYYPHDVQLCLVRCQPS